MLRKRRQKDQNDIEWDQPKEDWMGTSCTFHPGITSSEARMDIEYEAGGRGSEPIGLGEEEGEAWEQRVADCRYVLHPLYNDRWLVRREERRAFAKICTEILR